MEIKLETPLTEELQKAVDAGDIKAESGEVSISAKASPNGKDAKATYTRLTALTGRGMAVLCKGKVAPATPKPEGDDERTDAEKAPGACDYFNYGFDLDARAQVRAKLMTSLEGPEKAIQKAIKALVENAGFTEAAAREIVVAQRKAQNLPV